MNMKATGIPQKTAKRRKPFPAAKAATYLLLLFGLLIMVTPMVYMLTSSLRPNSMTFSYPPKILPGLTEVTVENYKYVLFRQNFFGYLGNTLFTAIISTAVTAAVSSMLAYCISRFRFPGRNVLFGTIIATMLIPGLSMLVPQFELAVTFKMINSIWGVICFYTAWMTPFSTFLVKSYVDGIPRELDEATYMDGGSLFSIYFRVILPLASPSVAAISIFNFLFPFEELGWSQTILKTDKIRTLPVAITQFFQAHNRTDWGYVFAMTCLAMVPVVILYVALQKYFVIGLSSGAIKE